VLIYRFSIHNADGSDREATGRMALRDDKAARAFGKAMIRDMMRGDNARYADWTMDVAKGTRPICSIPFSRNESRPLQLDSVGKEYVVGTSAVERPVVRNVEDE
jgi:hypothetical protein